MLRALIFILAFQTLQCSKVVSTSNLTQCTVGLTCQVVVNSFVDFYGNNDTVTYFDPFNNGEVTNITFSHMVTTVSVYNTSSIFTAIDPKLSYTGGCLCPFDTSNDVMDYSGEGKSTCDGQLENGEQNQYVAAFWTMDQDIPSCGLVGHIDYCIEYVFSNGSSYSVYQSFSSQISAVNIEYNGTIYQLIQGSDYSFGQFNISVEGVKSITPDIASLGLIATDSGFIASYNREDIVTGPQTPNCHRIGWFNGEQDRITDPSAQNCNYQSTPIINDCSNNNLESTFTFATLDAFHPNGDFNWYGIYVSHSPVNGLVIANPILVTISNQQIVFNSFLPNNTIISAPSSKGGIHILCLNYPVICVCSGEADRCVNGESKGGFILLYNNISIQGNYWGFINENFEIVPDTVNGLTNIEFNQEASVISLKITSSQLIPEAFINDLIPVIWEAYYSTTTHQITLVISSSSLQQGECVLELSDGTSTSIYVTTENKTIILNSESSFGKIYCLNHAAQFNIETANNDNDPGNFETGTNTDGGQIEPSLSIWNLLLSYLYWIIAFLALNLLGFFYARAEFVSVDTSDGCLMKQCMCLIAPILGFPYFIFMFAENRHFKKSIVLKKELELQPDEKRKGAPLVHFGSSYSEENEIPFVLTQSLKAPTKIVLFGRICVYLGAFSMLSFVFLFIVLRL
jgi:hypothetical protein